MSKWCSTCYRNETTGEWKSCGEDCPVFGKSFEELAKRRLTMNFNIGDIVYASDWCYGEIVDIDGDFISVEFDTGSGGGTCLFEAYEVRLAEKE